MEDADPGFGTEVAVDGLVDHVVVRDERRDVVGANVAPRVPAVVSEVVHHEVEPLAQLGPERVVEVDGKPVAVTQHQPRPVGVAVPAENEAAAVGGFDLDRRVRFGHSPVSPLPKSRTRPWPGKQPGYHVSM